MIGQRLLGLVVLYEDFKAGKATEVKKKREIETAKLLANKACAAVAD
jgi:hypothetical protein